jgi:hypothetical protein
MLRNSRVAAVMVYLNNHNYFHIGLIFIFTCKDNDNILIIYIN